MSNHCCMHLEKIYFLLNASMLVDKNVPSKCHHVSQCFKMSGVSRTPGITQTGRAGDLWEKPREEEVLQMKAVQPPWRCAYSQHAAGQMCTVSQGCAQPCVHYWALCLWAFASHLKTFHINCTKAVPGMERGALVCVIRSVLYWTVPTEVTFFFTKTS